LVVLDGEDPELAEVEVGAPVESPSTETGAPAVALTMEPEGFSPGPGAVALLAIAACLNASKLFASVGLMANTIPFWQCVKLLATTWLQKNHKGAEAFSTVILQVGNPEAPLGSDTFWNPELTPAAVQGAAKVDWTTEWFFETNWKLTMSPLFTPVKFVGLKVRVLLSPTRTLKVAAWTEAAAERMAAVATEKRILARYRRVEMEISSSK